MSCESKHGCPCPKDCVNHAKCCDCVAKHRGMDQVPYCIYPNEGVKSIESFYHSLKEKFG